MHFNIEHHIIPLYAVMLIIAFISMFIFMGISLYKYKVPFLLIGYSLVITSFCVICGGVLFSIFTNYDGNFSFDNMGLSSYGGAIGLIVSTFIFTTIYKKDRAKIITAYFLSIPLMYGISKLGCFLGGCCYGIPYDNIGYVQYNVPHAPDIPLLPIQLIETISFLIIFFLCCYLFFGKKYKYTQEILIITCALAKFYLDYYRYSHINIGISINQIVSLIFIGLAFVSLIVKNLTSYTEK